MVLGLLWHCPGASHPAGMLPIGREMWPGGLEGTAIGWLLPCGTWDTGEPCLGCNPAWEAGTHIPSKASGSGVPKSHWRGAGVSMNQVLC